MAASAIGKAQTAELVDLKSKARDAVPREGIMQDKVMPARKAQLAEALQGKVQENSLRDEILNEQLGRDMIQSMHETQVLEMQRRHEECIDFMLELTVQILTATKREAMFEHYQRAFDRICSILLSKLPDKTATPTANDFFTGLDKETDSNRDGTKDGDPYEGIDLAREGHAQAYAPRAAMILFERYILVGLQDGYVAFCKQSEAANDIMDTNASSFHEMLSSPQLSLIRLLAMPGLQHGPDFRRHLQTLFADWCDCVRHLAVTAIHPRRCLAEALLLNSHPSKAQLRLLTLDFVRQADSLLQDVCRGDASNAWPLSLFEPLRVHLEPFFKLLTKGLQLQGLSVSLCAHLTRIYGQDGFVLSELELLSDGRLLCLAVLLLATNLVVAVLGVVSSLVARGHLLGLPAEAMTAALGVLVFRSKDLQKLSRRLLTECCVGPYARLLDCPVLTSLTDECGPLVQHAVGQKVLLDLRLALVALFRRITESYYGNDAAYSLAVQLLRAELLLLVNRVLDRQLSVSSLKQEQEGQQRGRDVQFCSIMATLLSLWSTYHSDRRVMRTRQDVASIQWTKDPLIAPVLTADAFADALTTLRSDVCELGRLFSQLLHLDDACVAGLAPFSDADIPCRFPEPLPPVSTPQYRRALQYLNRRRRIMVSTGSKNEPRTLASSKGSITASVSQSQSHSLGRGASGLIPPGVVASLGSSTELVSGEEADSGISVQSLKPVDPKAWAKARRVKIEVEKEVLTRNILFISLAFRALNTAMHGSSSEDTVLSDRDLQSQLHKLSVHQLTSKFEACKSFYNCL